MTGNVRTPAANKTHADYSAEMLLLFSLHREKCSENNVSTTKYPCVKSTGEITTCYRYGADFCAWML